MLITTYLHKTQKKQTHFSRRNQILYTRLIPMTFSEVSYKLQKKFHYNSLSKLQMSSHIWLELIYHSL